ncbi:acyltransferase [Helicobacter pullorum]|uniref:acyltransferase n=1 Tax=Helicobacter pullorum TaxID=35818 RepID=UPI001F3BBFDB|nr:acyltransferase [Helicobacter pullorum]
MCIVESGTRIWQFCVVLPSAIIGENYNICSHCFIENDVFIGPNVTFCNDKYPRSKQYPKEFSKAIIKKGASIGANATILPGVTIGENAMIGAGAVKVLGKRVFKEHENGFEISRVDGFK